MSSDQRKLMGEKIAEKNSRIEKSVQNNLQIEMEKENAFQDKMVYDQKRQERLDDEKRLFQEMAQKRSLQLMLKRKSIHEESCRKLEDRRNELLDHQDHVDHKLMEHDNKKERYLEFKRELDGLKEKNKTLNVERMRRRMEHRREMISEGCRQKMGKADCVQLERKRLWDERRRTALISQKARDQIKSTIMGQRIKSNFDSQIVKEQLRAVFMEGVLNPEVQPGHRSLPNLQLS